MIKSKIKYCSGLHPEKTSFSGCRGGSRASHCVEELSFGIPLEFAAVVDLQFRGTESTIASGDDTALLFSLDQEETIYYCVTSNHNESTFHTSYEMKVSTR